MKSFFRFSIACVFIAGFNANASLADKVYRAIDGVLYNGPVIICAAGAASVVGIMTSNPQARQIDDLWGPTFLPMAATFFGTLFAGNYLVPLKTPPPS